MSRLKTICRGLCEVRRWVIAAAMVFLCGRCPGQIWISNSPIEEWRAMAISTNGQVVFGAGFGSGLYFSTNGGFSWITAGVSNATWQSVACSADGRVMIGVAFSGAVANSTDTGVTWNQFGVTNTAWWSVAASADGANVAALPFNGLAAVSVNYGSNFVFYHNAPVASWSAVASSADGTGLVAVSQKGDGNPTGLIDTSSDSGLFWGNSGAAGLNWTAVALSADGTKIFAGANTNLIYYSPDFGSTWVTNNASPTGQWRSMSISTDSSKLAVVEAGSYGIYETTNSGMNWAKLPFPSYATCAAISGDGNTIVAGSTDHAYVLNTLPPTLTITPSGGNAVLSWPLWKYYYLLEQNSNLLTTNWTATAAGIVTNGNQLQVTVPGAHGNMFYRLSLP